MAQAVAAGKPFDLAILDMQMPEMDGLQPVRQIKAQPQLAAADLIMLTSTYSAGSALNREQVGVLRCLTKPVPQSESAEYGARGTGRERPGTGVARIGSHRRRPDGR
jgi:two-component system sensor histidine kinase/response regulator